MGRIIIMKQLKKIALMAGCLAALPVAARATEATAIIRVDLRTLDLGSPDGMTAAQRRIDRAVRNSCRNDVEHLAHKARRAARLCRDTMRGLAMDQLYARRFEQLAAR